MKNQREALLIQLKAVPVERKQLEAAGRQITHMLGFTGEKELNLNNELGARRNALIFKIQLSQLAPFLQGVALGGVRMVHDKKDGNGENFLAIDVNSALGGRVPASTTAKTPRPGMKNAPSLIMRLNQSLFESDAVLAEEKKAMGNKIKELTLSTGRRRVACRRPV